MNVAGRIPVLDIGKHRRVWLLSADGRDAVQAAAVETCHGVGATYPKPFSAVFVMDGLLWLQIGRRRWDVANIADVFQEADGVRQARYSLALRDGSRETITIKFPRSVSAFRVLDITHDEIESWSEDIMKTLPYTAADGWRSDPSGSVAEWAARVTPMWACGIQLPAEEPDGRPGG